MPTTANRGYPYDTGSDPPQGNARIQELAEAVDADVAALPILQAKKSIIAAEQTRGTGLDYLGTPDKVTGIVVPPNGLIVVLFMALVKNTSGFEGKAAIVIDDDPVTRWQGGGGGPGENERYFPNDAGEYKALVTTGAGLATVSDSGTPEQTAPSGPHIVGLDDSVSGDQRQLGGPCYIVHPAGGEVDVGIQFGGDSGTTSAKNRCLWVWSMAFA